jgi:hypothetical protein
VFVPYLSPAIKDYLDAPVPYFMGISKGERTRPDCFIVDLDECTVKQPETPTMPLPPEPYTTNLVKDLKEITGSTNELPRKWLRARNAFKQFFISIFKDIKSYMVGSRFNYDGFLAT